MISLPMHGTDYMKHIFKASLLAALVLFVGTADAGRDGSGTYSLPTGNPVSSGTVISSTWANTTLSDIATELSSSLAKDGQTVPTANLPMGGYKHTGVADGSARNQYASIGQLQDFSVQTLGSISGTNTITGALSPAITSYVTGSVISFVPTGNNTGATTLSVNGLAARNVLKQNGTALASGDIVSGIPALLMTAATTFQLLNPQVHDATSLTGALPAISGASLTSLSTASISAGTLPVARGGTGVTTSTGTGNVVLSAAPTFTGTLTAATISATTIQQGGSGVWTAANDGTGSGLDADTVDGSHASAFAASSHTHTMASITDLPTVAAGVYTPTGTTGTAISAITPAQAFYHRLGNYVFVRGSAIVAASASNTTSFVTLPVASNLVGATDLTGTGVIGNAGSTTAVLTADTTNDRALITTTGASTPTSIYFEFAYVVQ